MGYGLESRGHERFKSNVPTMNQRISHSRTLFLWSQPQRPQTYTAGYLWVVLQRGILYMYASLTLVFRVFSLAYK